MPKSSAAEQSGESSTQTLSLLDEIIAKGRMAHDDSQQDYARDMLAEFATQVSTRAWPSTRTPWR